MNRFIDSSMSSNPYSVESQDCILSQRTRNSIKEKSKEVVQNVFRMSSCRILESSKVNSDLEKLNLKVLKLETITNRKIQTLSNHRAESSFNAILDKMLENLKPFDL